jgi:hypothetical protein
MPETASVIPTRQMADVLFQTVAPLAAGATFPSDRRRIGGYAAIRFFALASGTFTIFVEQACSQDGPWTRTDTLTSSLDPASGLQRVCTRVTPCGVFMRMFLENTAGVLQTVLQLCVLGMPHAATASSWQLVWADSGGLPGGATRFMRPGTAPVAASETRIRIPRPAVAKFLSVRALSGPGGALTDTFTVRKNGVDTALAVALAGAAASEVNDADQVPFNAGDEISVKVVAAPGTATADVVVTVFLL